MSDAEAEDVAAAEEEEEEQKHEEEEEEEEQNTNLIVNYIPQSIAEAGLRAMFSAHGEVERCKLVVDRATGLSKGFGFVRFATADGAARARRALDGLQLGTKRLKVSLARAPSADIRGANLYVANLEHTLTRSELEQVFARFGRVIEAKVITDRATGLSKGIAFVRFDRRAEAQAAVAALNKAVLPGVSSRGLSVKFADSSSSSSSSSSSMPQLQQPPPTGFLQQMRFNPFAVPPHPHQHHPPPPPAAAVNYPPAAQQALFNPMFAAAAVAAAAAAATAAAAAAAATSGTPAGPCVFVYNLPPSTDEAALAALFSPFGAVTRVHLPRDPATGRLRGYGFANMIDPAAAQRAIAGLNGLSIQGKVLQVSLKR